VEFPDGALPTTPFQYVDVSRITFRHEKVSAALLSCIQELPRSPDTAPTDDPASMDDLAFMDGLAVMDDTTSESDEGSISDNESTSGDDIREDSREEYMVQLYLASGVNEDRFRETINPVDGNLTYCFLIDCLKL
jgi:hypothetical protein